MAIEKTINVLYLDHTSQWSGGEISLFNLITYLDYTKVTPVVILPKKGILFDQLKSAGIKTYIVDMDEKWFLFKKESIDKNVVIVLMYIFMYIKYALMIKKTIKNENIKIIHCNSLKSDIYGYFLSFFTGCKCIWHVRDHINDRYLTQNVARVFRLLASFAPDKVIANSESTKYTLFPNLLGDKICKVIYDGVRDEVFDGDNAVEHNFKPGKTLKIGMVGRISPWKGQHVFIDAVIELEKCGYIMEYYIIGAPLFGEDDYQQEVIKKSKNVSSEIYFMGFQMDVKLLLSNLDILVHCSILPEPFGQVIIEGMAEGLPVIVSDAGGVREIVQHNINGLRTRPGDPVELARALQKLIDEPSFASQLGQEAYRCVRTKFTASRAAREVELLYCELMS